MPLLNKRVTLHDEATRLRVIPTMLFLSSKKKKKWPRPLMTSCIIFSSGLQVGAPGELGVLKDLKRTAEGYNLRGRPSCDNMMMERDFQLNQSKPFRKISFKILPLGHVAHFVGAIWYLSLFCVFLSPPPLIAVPAMSPSMVNRPGINGVWLS